LDINNTYNIEEFPRKATKSEKYFLFAVLPENKPGYKYYRNRIKSLFITGYGRFGMNNYIFGKENSKTDISMPTMPVLASGTIKIEEDEIDVTIHEEFEFQIETDISPKHSENLPEHFTELSRWSYSEWNPGDNAPNDRSFVKEIEIVRRKFILAIAPAHKKIWLHETATGINYLIPVSNFYTELMSVKGIRDSKIALRPINLFNEVEKYSDQDFINAFIKYNLYLRRINFDFSGLLIHDKPEHNHKWFNIFRKE